MTSLKKDRITGEKKRRNQETSRIIQELREKYALKDLLPFLHFPKSTYMYWQKRQHRENPDQPLENAILEIRKKHENYGYRRIYGELRRNGIRVNKKKVQRLVQNLQLQVKNFTRKSRKYSSYQGQVGRIAANVLNRNFKADIAHAKDRHRYHRVQIL